MTGYVAAHFWQDEGQKKIMLDRSYTEELGCGTTQPPPLLVTPMISTTDLQVLNKKKAIPPKNCCQECFR